MAQHEAPAVLDLMRAAFAYMAGVIDPPSSISRLALADLAQGEVWVLGDPIRATVMLTPKGERLYLGKLAVAEAARGQGLARVLVEHAVAEASARGFRAVELQVRVELTGNQAAFQRMGFVESARTAHAGYTRPTTITYQHGV